MHQLGNKFCDTENRTWAKIFTAARCHEKSWWLAEKRLEMNSNENVVFSSLYSENIHNIVKAELTVCEFVATNSQPRKKSWRSLLLTDQVSYSSTASVCRIAFFKQHWWLTAMCCKWGRSPDLREPTKAQLKRSEEKKDGMKAELPGWRHSFGESQSNCISSHFLLTLSLSEEIIIFVFFL